MLAVAGRNGAGKSTLLSVISGLRRPTRGEVLLDGRPLTALTALALARRRAVLRQQDTLTAPLLAREVVALGRHPHGDGDPHGAPVARAMEEAEVAHLADRLVDTLSGGERQRVQLARVLAQLDGGGVLLLDEPTSALDLAWQHRVLERVQQLARSRGLAVLAVLHDLNLAACFCDELLILRQGRQVARGAPEDVLTRPRSGTRSTSTRTCWRTRTTAGPRSWWQGGEDD